MVVAAEAAVDVVDLFVAQGAQDLAGLLRAPSHLAAHQESLVLGEDGLRDLRELRVGAHLPPLHVEKGDVDGTLGMALHEFGDGTDVHVDGVRILVEDRLGLIGGGLLN